MFKVLLLVVSTLVISSLQVDPVIDQLPLFKNTTTGPIGTLTTSAGVPVENDDTESSLNTNLNMNAYFMDSMSHFVKEKIPERIVHGKGAGAFGYFKPTQDISEYCKASLFEVGTTTPVAVRFSVAQGSPETSRTLVGFAVKFYTDQGNFDLVGLNSPTFVLKDPLLFMPFIHAFKRNPATNLKDVNMVWDYITLHPESIYTFLRVFGDRGITNGYRHMPGYSIQTYEVYNASGTKSYVRFQFIPSAGIEYLNSTAAASISASDPDYCTRDLYTAIGNGNYPTWKVNLQILSEDDVKDSMSDIFDISKSISEETYPPQYIGDLVLNRNPTNYFAEVEQVAFNPANVVSGIAGAGGKAYEARVMFYRQAQEHRLGPNYNNILVNCPYQSSVHTYNRDGAPPVKHNENDSPNYYENSFNGSVPYDDPYRPSLVEVTEEEPDNFDQANDYFTNEMSSAEQNRFVQTVAKSLCYTTSTIQNRAVEVFAKINSTLSTLLTTALSNTQCTH